MKSQPFISLISLFFAFILFSHCNKSEEAPAPKLSLENTSLVSETDFTANWSLSATNIASVIINISLHEDLKPLLKSITVDNPTAKSHTVKGLKGATTYYFQVVATLDNGSTHESEIKKVVTSYKTDVISLTTSDGYQLAGRIKYLESTTKKGPGAIFMHELGAFVNNWNSTDLITDLIAEGYVCLVFDFRGHGQSDDFDLQEIAGDLSVVVPDLIAALSYLKNHEKVDSSSIALVGGSLGAITAIAGNGYPEVKCTVALSGARNSIYSIFPGMKINSAFFIAGELDNAGTIDFAAEAQKLYDIAEDPKKLKIVAGRPEHGSNLLLVDGLKDEIIEWINTCLNDE